MLTLLVLVLILVFCVSGWTEFYFYTRLQEDILVTLRPSILYQSISRILINLQCYLRKSESSNRKALRNVSISVYSQQ
jgi:hypothetical protein